MRAGCGKNGAMFVSLDEFNKNLVGCERCPRLRAWCRQVAAEKRRQWRDWEYWGKPVPSFGDPNARVLIMGLAPGAHGSNRTGRPFTGDGSGDFMFPVLYQAGYASQARSVSREDGLRLTDLWITASVRCAPPENKPTPEEQKTCAPWLDAESPLLKRLRVVVALGKIGFDAYVAHLIRTGVIARRGALHFGHGVEYELPNGVWLVGTYHPSLQNTNTGKLTEAMFLRIFQRARELAEG